MRFLQPSIAWWLGGAFALAVLLRWGLSRRFGVASTTPWIFRARYRASLFRRLPSLLLLAALALTGLALLEPVLPYADVEVQAKGLDIVLAVDLSSSMQEPIEHKGPSAAQLAAMRLGQAPPPEAPAQTRLDATKDAIRDFINRRREDRIGLVVFSDNAYVVSPPTFDRAYLLQYVDMIDDQMLRNEGMTAIGEGLALSDFLLTRRDVGARNKVVVIFTDGESNAGRDPVEMLAQANDANIRVHLVGVALEREEKDKPRVRQLIASVRRFGGRYFDAQNARDLDAASRAIDSIEKGVLVGHRYERDVAVYPWFALPALVCLALALALAAMPAFIDQT